MNNHADGVETAPWRLLLAGVLWAATAILSVVLIVTTRDAVTRVYAAFWSDGAPFGRSYWSAVAIQQFLTIPLAMFAVVVIIGGVEYHLRNVNTERSWKLLAYTLAFEVALILVAFIL